MDETTTPPQGIQDFTPKTPFPTSKNNASHSIDDLLTRSQSPVVFHEEHARDVKELCDYIVGRLATYGVDLLEIRLKDTQGMKVFGAYKCLTNMLERTDLVEEDLYSAQSELYSLAEKYVNTLEEQQKILLASREEIEKAKNSFLGLCEEVFLKSDYSTSGVIGGEIDAVSTKFYTFLEASPTSEQLKKAEEGTHTLLQNLVKL